MATNLDNQNSAATGSDLDAAWVGAVVLFFVISWVASVGYAAWILTMGCHG